jgi:hypothetical protein
MFLFAKRKGTERKKWKVWLVVSFTIFFLVSVSVSLSLSLSLLCVKLTQAFSPHSSVHKGKGRKGEGEGECLVGCAFHCVFCLCVSHPPSHIRANTDLERQKREHFEDPIRNYATVTDIASCSKRLSRALLVDWLVICNSYMNRQHAPSDCQRPCSFLCSSNAQLHKSATCPRRLSRTRQ